MTDKYDDIMQRLIQLCYSENEQVALKACTEFFERTNTKLQNKTFYWFVSDENESN